MHVRSNWQSSSEVKRSHWGEKEEGSISRRPVGPHILTANAGSHNGHITARSLRGEGGGIVTSFSGLPGPADASRCPHRKLWRVTEK